MPVYLVREVCEYEVRAASHGQALGRVNRCLSYRPEWRPVVFLGVVERDVWELQESDYLDPEPLEALPDDEPEDAELYAANVSQTRFVDDPEEELDE